MSEETEFPVSDQFDVIEGRTLSKDGGWWNAVVTCDGFYGTEVNVYLWQENDDGSWSRKQKLNIREAEEWDQTKEAVDEFVNEYIREDEEEN